MRAEDELRLQHMGPRNYDEACYIRNAFCSCISRALTAMLISEQREYLAESDRWRVWLPETIVWMKEEIRRLALQPPQPISLTFPKPDR